MTLNTSLRPLPPLIPALSRRAWVLLGLAVLTMVLLELGGDGLRAALRYERDAILNGEVWRLLTGHLVHFDWSHLSLNLAGALLMVLLFSESFSLGQWMWVLVTGLVVIDAGFIFFEPQLVWYVGVSGVLHGVVAAGAVAWWYREAIWMAALLSCIVIGKLWWEQLQGGLPLSGDMPVVVDAHLYGAIGGAGAALFLTAIKGRAAQHRPL
jgi:rhomboid family GlyGly-CTERM serine protease